MRKSATTYDRVNTMSPNQCNEEEYALIGRNCCNFRNYWIGPPPQGASSRYIRSPGAATDASPGNPGIRPYLRRIRLFLLRVSIFRAFRASLRAPERADSNSQRKWRAQSAPPESGDRIPLRLLQRRRCSIIGRIVSKIERRGRRAGAILYAQPRQ